MEAAEDARRQQSGPRFFGFVVGGALPAASAADILTVGWDQAGLQRGALSPAAGAAEGAAGSWMKELLRLPGTGVGGIRTETKAGNTIGLAIGRNEVLARVGWDIADQGLYGAPGD